MLHVPLTLALLRSGALVGAGVLHRDRASGASDDADDNLHYHQHGRAAGRRCAPRPRRSRLRLRIAALVLAVLWPLPAVGAAPAAQDTPPAPRQEAVRIVGGPDWWLAPDVPGWSVPSEGRLYLGVTVENASDAPLLAALTLRAASGAGTGLTSCVDEVIDLAPHARGRVVCSRISLPRATTDLQVSARVSSVTPLMSPPLDYRITDGALTIRPATPFAATYDASALAQATGSAPTRAALLFRLYDADELQVAYCSTATLGVLATHRDASAAAAPCRSSTAAPCRPSASPWSPRRSSPADSRRAARQRGPAAAAPCPTAGQPLVSGTGGPPAAPRRGADRRPAAVCFQPAALSVQSWVGRPSPAGAIGLGVSRLPMADR